MRLEKFLIPLFFISICSIVAHAETKRAFLVGVSDYGNPRESPDEWSNISGANDVALLAPLFQAQGFDVSTLVDTQATHASIINGLKTIERKSKPGDLVYLHFSMHGQPFEDLNGDEEDGWDEALIPVDAKMQYVAGVYEGKNHLLDDELEGYFNRIRSKLGSNGQLYVVLDACHSGTASRGDGEHIRGVRDGFTRSGKLYTPNREKDTNDYFRVPTTTGQSPVTFLEACRAYQQNKEVRDATNNLWYGSLSYYIAQAMKANNMIDKSGGWIQVVKTWISGDRRLRKQNMVIESSR